MSADNFVGVRPNKDGTYLIFEYGNMSCYEEDCMYYNAADGSGNHIRPTRESALAFAHDLVNKMDICEYGVVEMPPVPDEPCGTCYVCVHVKMVASDSLPRCDGCSKPISNSEWQVTTSQGTFHSSCEPAKVTR